MLPPRSKRFVGLDGTVPRLHLLATWQLAVIALLMIALFFLIFPRRTLYAQLHRQAVFDELTHAYIANLRRAEPDNPDLLLLAIRERSDKLSLDAIETRLAPIVAGSRADLVGPAQELLAQARLRELQRLVLDFHGEANRFAACAQLYRQIMATGSPGMRQAARTAWIETLLHLPATTPRHQLQQEVRGLLTQDDLRMASPAERLVIAILAVQVGLSDAGHMLIERLDADWLARALPELARQAIGTGRYQTAAELFFHARSRAGDRATARMYFQAGIEALLADAQYQKVMSSAEQYLGDLADDPPTLRLLTRTALAAGDPQRAAQYARRLVFKTDTKGSR